MSGRMWRRWLTAASGVAGVVLFGVMLRAAGIDTVLGGVAQVGGGFVLIVLLGGLRLTARAAAWSACAGGPARLPFSSALGACIAGEAAGNVLPLGLAASEPAKVLWVRHHLDTVEAAASLATETLVYSLAVAGMLVAGSLAWVAVCAPAGWSRWVMVGLAALPALAGGLWRAANRGERPMVAVRRWLESRGRQHPAFLAVRDGVQRTGEMLGSLLRRQPRTLVWVSILQALFQVAAVAEVWLTLALIQSPRPTLLQAFLLEFANRVVTVAFKFVPMRVGVDELASAGMASLLGSAGTVGVTLAVVRKARVLCWTAAGLVLAGIRALTVEPARDGAPPLAKPFDA
jgi:hypothetical protein